MVGAGSTSFTLPSGCFCWDVRSSGAKFPPPPPPPDPSDGGGGALLAFGPSPLVGREMYALPLTLSAFEHSNEDQTQ
jgi:hypothetical protein